jgi:hypothetical protein
MLNAQGALTRFTCTRWYRSTHTNTVIYTGTDTYTGNVGTATTSTSHLVIHIVDRPVGTSSLLQELAELHGCRCAPLFYPSPGCGQSVPKAALPGAKVSSRAPGSLRVSQDERTGCFTKMGCHACAHKSLRNIARDLHKRRVLVKVACGSLAPIGTRPTSTPAQGIDPRGAADFQSTFSQGDSGGYLEIE